MSLEEKYSKLRTPRVVHIRVLPELKVIVETLSDFFGPDDAAPGETLVRKGRIVSRDGRVPECVLVYEKDNAHGDRVTIRYPGADWEHSSGYLDPTPAQAAAIATVIGRVV